MSNNNGGAVPSRGGIPPATPVDLAGLVEYSTGAVVSRTIRKSDKGTLTVFAFDKGEELSTHSAPYDAYVQILDGEAEIIIGAKAQGFVTPAVFAECRNAVQLQ